MTSPTAQRRGTGAARIFGIVLLAVSILGIVILGIALVPMLSPSTEAIAVAALPEPAPGGEAVPLESVRPSTAAAAAAPSSSAPGPTPGPDQPLTLAIPRLGLTANVGVMGVPADGKVNPPTPRSAYWIRGYGVAGPASDNTLYIAGHTFRQGKAVFNPLLDVPNSGVTVVEGDEIEVITPSGAYRYTVTSTEKYDKATIGSASELWQRMPGRLAIISCFQYNGGTSSTQNVVVYAQLVK